jgi:cysteinyl-tRNA synthetase
LQITPPTYEPRATAAIPEMLDLIERLIQSGYAYQAEDGTADVYFAASKWAKYGELTNQKIEDMAPDAEVELRGKRDPRDFALWKAHKAGDPASASWNTRFGAGRPGWHIECSAMATKYLGSQFDIHGGGLDLRFPHHENELAQSTAAGDAFANYWLHNGLVNVAGQKMSKSLGNSIFAADLLAAARPIVVRYYLGSAHYRSVLDYHEGVLDEAESAVSRIETFVEKAIRRLGSAPVLAAADLAAALPNAFTKAMDDDLAMPSALAALHDEVRAGNSALDSASDERLASSLRAVLAITSVLGINPLDWADASAGNDVVLENLVQALIADRNSARANKDFAQSDAIRNQLQAAGITLEDAADGTHWSVN